MVCVCHTSYGVGSVMVFVHTMFVCDLDCVLKDLLASLTKMHLMLSASLHPVDLCGCVDFGGGLRLGSDHCSMAMLTCRKCPGLGLYRPCGEFLLVLWDTCVSMRYPRHDVLSRIVCPLTS